MLEGKVSGGLDRGTGDPLEVAAAVGAAVALTALAVLVPIWAIALGPAMLAAGLLGLRRAGAGPRWHLVLLAALGATVSLVAVLVVGLWTPVPS
jgi:hypothetical protein